MAAVGKRIEVSKRKVPTKVLSCDDVRAAAKAGNAAFLAFVQAKDQAISKSH